MGTFAWTGLGNIIMEFCFALLRELGRLLRNVTDYRLHDDNVT